MHNTAGDSCLVECCSATAKVKLFWFLPWAVLAVMGKMRKRGSVSVTVRVSLGLGLALGMRLGCHMRTLPIACFEWTPQL